MEKASPTLSDRHRPKQKERTNESLIIIENGVLGVRKRLNIITKVPKRVKEKKWRDLNYQQSCSS